MKNIEEAGVLVGLLHYLESRARWVAITAALVDSCISSDEWNLKLVLTSSQTKWNAYPEITSSWHYRDESASATYYCKRRSVSESQEESTPTMEKEWIYYRKLKTGEEERCLRHKQVPGLALCSGKCGRSAVFRTSRLSLWPRKQSSAMAWGYIKMDQVLCPWREQPTIAFFRA